MVKIWMTTVDDMSCDRCRALFGRPEGDGWSMTGQTPENGWLPIGQLCGPPPLHAHCRCRIVEYDSLPSQPPSLVDTVASSGVFPPLAPLDPLAPTEFPVAPAR